MADSGGRFRSDGIAWSERARLGGLRAVLGPSTSSRNNEFINGIHAYGATLALRDIPRNASMVDFGCGNGRFAKFFAQHGFSVLGTEITPEMIEGARAECSELGCTFALTDGIRIPATDASLDAIWCCGVLRFSLFTDDPVYDQIAAEMFRVLRPGGLVFQLEVHVDQRPAIFLNDFEAVGFRIKNQRVLRRYGRLEHYLGHPRWPQRLIPWLGRRCGQIRYHFDHPERLDHGIRDYYFVFEKP